MKFFFFLISAVLLLGLKFSQVLPWYLTYRKIFFLLILIFLVIFKVSFRILAIIGLSFLSAVALLAFFGRVGVVSKLIVWAWGFLLLAALGQFFELLKADEKNR